MKIKRKPVIAGIDQNKNNIMAKTFKQLKALRQAKKQYKFDKRREKERNKNRTRKYSICLIFASCGVICSILCLTILFPRYADFKYQTSMNRLKLPDITEPCNVNIEILYFNNRPEKIKITNDNIPAHDINIIDDYSEKKVIINLDTNILSDKYELTVLPADNFELKYRISKQPSRKYIIYDINQFRDEKNNLWLDFVASFRHIPDNIYCIIKVRGPKYTRYLYEYEINQHDRYRLNLSELAEKQNIDLDKCTEFEITFSVKNNIDADGNELIIPSVYQTFDRYSWPVYNPDEYHDFNNSDTFNYLLNKQLIKDR